MEQQHVGEDAKQPGCAAHNASNVASSNVASSGPAAAQPSGTTKPAAVRLKPNNPIAKFKRPTNIKAPSSKPGMWVCMDKCTRPCRLGDDARGAHGVVSNSMSVLRKQRMTMHATDTIKLLTV